MRRKWLIAALAVATGVTVAGWIGVRRMSMSALPNPGQLETRLATAAKRRLIAREAAALKLSVPQADTARAAIGGMQFRASCAVCHGPDGREPTEIGRWMSPRAPDLGSPQVQSWSDAELFWIVKNGIRMTGMPAFGELHEDELIWDMVFFMRQIPQQP